MNELSIEEAIEVLQREIGDVDSIVFPEVEEALKMAIKALNKEIAKKPVQPHVRYGMGYDYWDYYCPVCDQYLAAEPEGDRWKSQGGWSRCDNCGQKIEWSKDDDE